MPKWKTAKAKLERMAKNITFDEVVALLEHFGYSQKREIKQYVVKDLLDILTQEGYL